MPLKGQTTVPKAADKGKSKDRPEPQAAKKAGNTKEPKPAEPDATAPPAASEKPN